MITNETNLIAYHLNVNLFNLTVATKRGGFSLFVNINTIFTSSFEDAL